jgi:tol-pal system protein YbgF
LARALPYLILALSWALLAAGCSRAKVASLEDQLAEERARRAALQAQMAYLEVRMEEGSNGDSLEAPVSSPEIVFQAEADSTPSALSPPEAEPIAEADIQIEQSTEAMITPLETVVEPPALNSEATPDDFQARYDAALALFREKKFTRAGQAFRALLESNRGHSLSDNCQFWLGECCYALRQFEQALVEFEKVFAFPRSNKRDTAQYKLALCYLQLGRFEEARAELRRLISTYPQSEYLEMARAHLAQLP